MPDDEVKLVTSPTIFGLFQALPKMIAESNNDAAAAALTRALMEEIHTDCKCTVAERYWNQGMYAIRILTQMEENGIFSRRPLKDTCSVASHKLVEAWLYTKEPLEEKTFVEFMSRGKLAVGSMFRENIAPVIAQAIRNSVLTSKKDHLEKVWRFFPLTEGYICSDVARALARSAIHAMSTHDLILLFRNIQKQPYFKELQIVPEVD